MFRTFAVLLLLLGLATATPVVCLCAPTDAAAVAAGLPFRIAQDAGTSAPASSAADAPNLVATSAAAIVASLVATAGGVPSTAPWGLPRPVLAHPRPPVVIMLPGLAWSPAVPPPR